MEHKRTEEALELVRKENDLWRYHSEKEEAKILQGGRKLRKDEEMAWAPPRNMSNWLGWEEAKSMKESEWRLEPEGEAEVPEIIIVSDAVESTNVDLDGKSRREQAEERSFRREREVPGEEGEEEKSPKRKVIRVESEETQDHVREAKSAEQEEVEERICVPSAISVPQKPLFRFDNRCSEKTLSYWQLASVVINEGEESYTTNLCQMCFNNSLKAKGETPLTNVQWRQVVEKKAYRGRIRRMMGKEPYVREMW